MAGVGPRPSRRIAPDRRVRCRREWQDTRRPAWVMWLSVVCLVGLVVTVVALAGSDRMSRPQAVNGDMLGPDNTETVDEYLVRAAASVQEAQETQQGQDADAPRWALVTPVTPAGPGELAEIFSGMPDLRVSTLMAGESRWQVPEPADGHRREDVFEASREQVASSAGVGLDDPSLDVLGVLVHATPADLRTLADRPGVLAVEALPPDAAYGRFGLRPVTVADREEIR